MKRLRRVLRWVAVFLGVLVLLVAGVWFYVTSDAGAARVRTAVLEAAGNALAGRLEAKTLHLSGGIIVIEDAKLYTPEGELVGELKRAELDLALSPLLRNLVQIRSANIDGLRLYLASDERGLNLARAVAAKVPTPESSAPTPRFQVEVRALTLTHGHVDWQKQYVAEDVAIDASEVTVKGPDLKLGGKLALSAKVNELPFDLRAGGDEQGLAVAATLGGARLGGELGIHGVSAQIAELFVPPDVAARFIEGFPLKVPLVARGAVSLKAVDLALEAGAARAKVKAQLDGATVPSFELSADDVDLAELLGAGRPAKLHVDATGRLIDPKPESLDFAVALNAKWASVGEAHLKAEAKAGHVTLERATVDVPGASLSLSGSGDAQAVKVSGALDADDLEKVSRVIAEVTGGAPPPLAGTGDAKLVVSGPLRHPRIKLSGDFQALHVADVSFNGLKLDAMLADATRPFEASVNAEVARITYGERSFDQARIKLDTRGRSLDVEVSTKGYAELSLLATGTVDADGQGIGLEALALRYPEEEWKLEGPTRISIAAGLEVQPFTLAASEGQRIAAGLTLKAGRLDAQVDLKQLELTHLPHAFVPTKWGLGGKVDAHVAATGKTKAPDVDATVTWRNGSLRTLRDLQLDLKGRYSKDRAAIDLAAKSNIGDLKARFDVPVSGLARETDEAVSADVSLERIALEAIGPLLETDVPATGGATLRVTAAGTAKQPRLTARVEVKDATWKLKGQTIQVSAAKLDVQPDDTGALVALLAVNAFGADAKVRLSTPFTAAGLRKHQPDLVELRATEVVLDADVRHVELKTLAEAGLVSADGLRGAVTVTLKAKGSVDHPDAEMTVIAEQVAEGRVKPIDATVTVTGSRADTKLTVLVSRPKVAGALVKVEATAVAPLEVLADVSRLASVAFKGGGDIGPFTLNDVLEPSDEAQPRGTVKANVEFSGTVVDPKVRVRGQLEQVAFGKVALGKANIAYDYEQALSTLAMTLFTGTSGTLRAKGTVQLDLSQPAVMKGLDWRGAPVALEATANGFDLAFLSGAIETVPKIEGRLDANAKVSGTLSLPMLTGRAALEAGRVQLQSFGEYRDIEMKLEGNNEAVTLERLYVKAGGGYADVKGVGKKRGDGWAVRIEGQTREFPIITDDQLKASATVEVTADGLISETLVDFTKISIPRATITLPDVKGKDLQDLERPDTIVLVRNGVPVNAKQKKRLAELKGEVPEAPPVPARVVRLAIDATENVWIKSSDVNAEIGLSEGFRVEVSQVASLFGAVYVKRGRLDVLGRRFDLDNSSTVRLTGPPLTNTYVNVIAVYKNEKEGVTVTATVVGQLPAFSIRLSSNPPMSESDIFTLVATGRRTLKTGGSATITGDQVASVLGALAARGFKETVGKKLPLDVMSFETGSDGLRGTRFEGGKYITDDIYVGGEVRYGADPAKGENDVAARFEYQFIPHWSFEAYGGNAAYGADLVWSREY